MSRRHSPHNDKSKRSKSNAKSQLGGSDRKQNNLRLLSSDKIFETTSQIGSVIPKSSHPKQLSQRRMEDELTSMAKQSLKQDYREKRKLGSAFNSTV